MFSPKQLLIRCATLLCLEHKEGVNTVPSKDLVGSILKILPKPEISVDHDHGRKVFIDLRNMVMWLNARSAEDFPGEQEVLQQAQVACQEETYLYEALLNALMKRYADDKEIIKTIQSYRSTLTGHLNEEQIIAIFREYSHKFLFKRAEVPSVVDEITEMGVRLEPLVKLKDKSKHPSLMDSIGSSNVEEIAKSLADVKVNMSAEGALRTGWKGINEMLGEVGAVRRGEFVLIGGLQHNFKSGFLLSLFVHAALFNKPMMRDPTKRPLLYFMTLENEVRDNLLWIYRYIYENDTGMRVDTAMIDTEEAAIYVTKRMSESGYEFIMDRFDPNDYTSASVIGTLESLQADGYEIHALFMDYFNLLSKAGIEAKVAGDDIRLLARRIYNYTSPRGITFYSPHQLSSDAQQLTRENVEDFVKLVANKGYYDGCRRLGQEPDIEFMIHNAEIQGIKYLTVNRGKHRNAVTPVEKHYYAMPYREIGTLPWDIDSDEEFGTRHPGVTMTESGELDNWC